jgi:hypothetical protein
LEKSCKTCGYFNGGYKYCQQKGDIVYPNYQICEKWIVKKKDESSKIG